MFRNTVSAANNRERRTFARIVAFTFLAFLGFHQAPASAQGRSDTLPSVGPVVLEGDLEVLYEDDVNEARLKHFLRVDNRRIPLLFQDGTAPDLPTGSHIRVTGTLADGTVTTTGVQVVTVSTSRTLGTKNVLIILINFSNNTSQPYTPSSTITVNNSVNNFYQENSYGQTSLNFTVAGWFTIAATNSTCNYSTWASQADAAATNAGYMLSAFDRRIYSFPQTSACSWWGLGYLSGQQAFVNGSYATRVVAHELGHTFGDYHSHRLQCDSTACVSVDYGDDRDVMGVSGVIGHFNAFQKERLGWLNYGVSPPARTVSNSDDYWIESYEAMPTGFPKALKIWNPIDSTYYYVESRAKTGFDTNVGAGVTIHRAGPTNGDSGYQIDLAPTTTTWDSTLDVGQSFKDDRMALNIQTLSSSSDGAMVWIDFGTLPCVANTPTAALSPSATSWVQPGSVVNYTMTVTNNDSSGCSEAAFSLTPILPVGWSAVVTPTSINALSPGASTSAAIAVSIPSTVAGSQQFTVTARESGAPLSADASVSMIVASTLGVAVSTDKTVYNGGTITVTATVTGNQTAVAGGAVAFTLKTGSKSIPLSATTNSNGVAVASYRLKAKDPKGAWQVTASATKDAVTGSGSANFTVQ